MDVEEAKSTLCEGSKAISRKLTRLFNPSAHLFQPEEPRSKSRSRLTKVLIGAFILISIWSSFKINTTILVKLDEGNVLFKFLKSKFIVRLYVVYAFFRVSMVLIILLITRLHRKAVQRVLSTRVYLIDAEKQVQLAIRSFYVSALKSAIKCYFIAPVLWPDVVTLVCVIIVFTTLDLGLSVPSMYIHYISSSFAEHVTNFLKVRVEVLFEQSEKRPEVEAANSRSWLRSFAKTLCSNRYLPLEDMNMVESLPTTVSPEARKANQELISGRLQETLGMLINLRDAVNDINRMSAPIVLVECIHEAYIVVIVSTGFIQNKFYETFNVVIFITIGSVLSLIIHVFYSCICLDSTVAALRVLVNKLFDFIIINNQRPPEDAQREADENTEAITEIWSQFQFVRQLAESIQFSMGGLLPVSRRLILSVLTHILSTVFIAIEAMNIVDTKQGATNKF